MFSSSKTGKPLSKLSQVAYLMKIKYKIARKKGNEGKKTTTKSFVKSVYDQDAWEKVLKSKYWHNVKSLENFLVIPSPGFHRSKDNMVIALIEGKLVRINIKDILQYIFRKHYEIMKNYIDSTDKIVEVGCGYGIKLFSLRCQGLKNPMMGTEVSENGINSAIEINRHFNCNINFEQMDLTSIENNKVLRGKTVYSYFALEQLKHYTHDVIENLLKSEPKRVLHFEPIFELYDNTLLDNMKKKYIKNHDYQDNLLTTLQNFEKENRLEILEAKRLRFNINPFVETCLIHWIPTNFKK